MITNKASLVLLLGFTLFACESSSSTTDAISTSCSGSGTADVRINIENQVMFAESDTVDDSRYDFQVGGLYTVDYNYISDPGDNASGTYVYTVDPTDSTKAEIVLTQTSPLDPVEDNLESWTETFTIYGSAVDTGSYCMSRTATYVDSSPDSTASDSGSFGFD